MRNNLNGKIAFSGFNKTKVIWLHFSLYTLHANNSVSTRNYRGKTPWYKKNYKNFSLVNSSDYPSPVEQIIRGIWIDLDINFEFISSMALVSFSWTAAIRLLLQLSHCPIQIPSTHCNQTQLQHDFGCITVQVLQQTRTLSSPLIHST
jgi:hypothetical protein